MIVFPLPSRPGPFGSALLGVVRIWSGAFGDLGDMEHWRAHLGHPPASVRAARGGEGSRGIRAIRSAAGASPSHGINTNPRRPVSTRGQAARPPHEARSRRFQTRAGSPADSAPCSAALPYPALQPTHSGAGVQGVEFLVARRAITEKEPPLAQPRNGPSGQRPTSTETAHIPAELSRQQLVLASRVRGTGGGWRDAARIGVDAADLRWRPRAQCPPDLRSTLMAGCVCRLNRPPTC
jgi:hypothetical protein